MSNTETALTRSERNFLIRWLKAPLYSEHGHVQRWAAAQIKNLDAGEPLPARYNLHWTERAVMMDRLNRLRDDHDTLAERVSGETHFRHSERIRDWANERLCELDEEVRYDERAWNDIVRANPDLAALGRVLDE